MEQSEFRDQDLRSVIRRPGKIDLYIATRIRDRRIALGISQGRLGRVLGLSLEQIRKYENGANRISAGRLFVIAKALTVSVQYFYPDLDEDALQKGSVAESMQELPQLLGATKEFSELGRAFFSIVCQKRRRAVITLIESIGTLPSTSRSLKNPPDGR